jgi:hypothetical protein
MVLRKTLHPGEIRTHDRRLIGRRRRWRGPKSAWPTSGSLEGVDDGEGRKVFDRLPAHWKASTMERAEKCLADFRFNGRRRRWRGPRSGWPTSGSLEGVNDGEGREVLGRLPVPDVRGVAAAKGRAGADLINLQFRQKLRERILPLNCD